MRGCVNVCFGFTNMCSKCCFLVFVMLTKHGWAWDSSWGDPFVEDTEHFKTVYDFIVIGAGTGGCTVANRLTEQADWNVLLIEAGGEENFATDIPIAGPVPGAFAYNWHYKSQPSATSCLGMDEGRCIALKGKIMGGSSTINLMVYSRGNSLDFDEWESCGNPGWSYSKILKYFIKSEKVSGIYEIDESFRGKNGSVSVEYAKYTTPLLDRFLKAGQELGYCVRDLNGAHQIGFSRVQATLRDGRRCSASKAYIRPIKNRPNLHVTKNAHVTKILIDSFFKIAIGVEFVKNEKHRVYATREVILSAGAINSPQLLMLSGIGPKDHLEELNIPCVRDLKVGHNLQDHPYFFGLTFLINDSVSITSKTLLNFRNAYDYIFHSKGPFTVPGGTEGLAFMEFERRWKHYPDIEIVLGAGGLNQDAGPYLRKLMGIPEHFYKKVFKPIRNLEAFSLVPVLMRPESRGKVMLRSTNPFDPPFLYANFFEKEEDVKRLIKGVKLAIAIGESNAFKIFNTTLHKEPYPGCEHLSWGSDEYWECCARRYSNSLFHQSGTCRMGPKEDPTAVVDHRLRVHGISGLRVVDASIMPHLPAGHPNAVVFMIGEKAADMIKEDWLGTSFGF